MNARKALASLTLALFFTACGGGYSGFVIPIESPLKPWTPPDADSLVSDEDEDDEDEDFDYENFEDEGEEEEAKPAAAGAAAPAAAAPAPEPAPAKATKKKASKKAGK